MSHAVENKGRSVREAINHLFPPAKFCIPLLLGNQDTYRLETT